MHFFFRFLYSSDGVGNERGWIQKPEKEMHNPEDLVRMFFVSVDRDNKPKDCAVLPYIKGLTEPLTRSLRKFDIKVTNKSTRDFTASISFT